MSCSEAVTRRADWLGASTNEVSRTEYSELWGHPPRLPPRKPRTAQLSVRTSRHHVWVEHLVRGATLGRHNSPLTEGDGKGTPTRVAFVVRLSRASMR
eukprot:7435874-Pyramimonas_sp.AAC.1